MTLISRLSKLAMPKRALLCVLFFAATPTLAQVIPKGCFVRDYSQDHLAQNPEQIVDRISILFSHDDPPYVGAHVQVLLADQGHAGRDGYGGKRVSEWAGNFIGPFDFGVECDGGGFDVIALDDGGITIETEGMRLAEDGCVDEGFNTTLRESGNATTRYRLNRADLEACQW